MKPEPLSFLVRRFQKQVAAAYGEGGYRIPIARMAVLDALHRYREPMSQTLLCEMSGTDRSSLSALLPALADQDYIDQIQSKADRREKQISITQLGVDMLEHALKDLHEAESVELRKIPKTKREHLAKALEKLTENP